jgi:hypothetical protein
MKYMYTWLKKCVDCKSAPYFTNTISDFLIENKKCLFTVVNACICLSYMSGFDSTYSLFNITSSLFHLWRMLSTQSEHHRFSLLRFLWTIRNAPSKEDSLNMMSTPVHMRELCLHLNCYICKIWYTNWISNTFLVRYACKWI